MTQSEAIDAGENIILLDINKLVVTSQPMIEASQIEKDGLSESIEEVGLLYPLLVKPLGSGKKYEVLDGRTRLEVLKELGRSVVKCTIRYGDSPSKSEAIPYDCEIHRRHLNKEEKERFTRIRDEKKAEGEKKFVKHMLTLIPQEFRGRSKEYLDTLATPEMKRDIAIVMTTFSESGLKDFLNNVSIVKKCEKLEKERLRLESEKNVAEKDLLEANQKKEEQIQERMAQLEERLKAEIEKKKVAGLILPDDPAEKTQVLRKIEKAVTEKMRKEVKDNILEGKEQLEKYNKIVREMEEKNIAIEALRKEAKDAKAELKSSDDMVQTYLNLLNKQTSISKAKEKLDYIADDLKRLNDLLMERQYTSKELGKKGITMLFSQVKKIRKLLGETEWALKEINEMNEEKN